jgi:hypothetical protein
MEELKKYFGKSFEFAEQFTCYISEEGVWIEEYYEGQFCLKHIKTEKQLIQLYEILTGQEFSLNAL